MSSQPLPIGSEARTVLQKMRPYRLLLVVYGLAISVGVWEVTHRGLIVNVYLDPNPNFTDTLTKLYPDRGEAQYAKALQAIQCAQARQLRRPTPATCQQYRSEELVHEVKSYFERSLGTGIKHDQGLYYEYLQFLVLTNGKQADIDAAYEAWRRNFPLSRLPDPRKLPQREMGRRR